MPKISIPLLCGVFWPVAAYVVGWILSLLKDISSPFRHLPGPNADSWFMGEGISAILTFLR